MKQYRFAVAARAEADARAAAAWWAENRPDARRLFEDELRAAFERITLSPLSGAPYRETRKKDVRRVLLDGSRYHVYYTVDTRGGRVFVRAIWHAARGRGPRLP